MNIELPPGTRASPPPYSSPNPSLSSFFHRPNALRNQSSSKSPPPPLPPPSSSLHHGNEFEQEGDGPNMPFNSNYGNEPMFNRHTPHRDFGHRGGIYRPYRRFCEKRRDGHRYRFKQQYQQCHYYKPGFKKQYQSGAMSPSMPSHQAISPPHLTINITQASPPPQMPNNNQQTQQLTPVKTEAMLPHRPEFIIDALYDQEMCIRSPLLFNRKTNSRRSLDFPDENILQVASSSDSKEQQCLNESNAEKHLLDSLKLGSSTHSEAHLSDSLVPTLYNSSRKYSHLYCKLNFSSPESTESNLVNEKYVLSPNTMLSLSPSGPCKTLEQPELSLSSDAPDYDFSTCKRIIREDFDEYYKVRNTNNCNSQRQTHALFGDRKNKRYIPNLVLPDKRDGDNIENTGSLHGANLISDPMLSPFNDISPGVLCSPTIFDIPGSDNYLMKLPSLSDASNRDCNNISPEIMIKVLRGEYGKYLVIDCRFPFEYNGGHIKNAINIFEPDALEYLLLAPQNSSEFLFTSSNVHIPSYLREQIDNLDEQVLSTICKDPKNLITIFHCEFSQKRGPKLYRHLRELDRQQHVDSYPELYYPNIYILEGGYRGFWQCLTNSENNEKQERYKSSEFCIPDSYTSMDDNNYIEEKKKSWNLMTKAWKRKKAVKTFSIRRHNSSRF